MDKRTQRQIQLYRAWKANRARGTISAVTGFGKTAIGLRAIRQMNNNAPELKTLVVVPTLYLKDQWSEKVAEMQNVYVEVINSVIRHRFRVDLLILDEIHCYCAPLWRRVFTHINAKFIMGLTATKERPDEEDRIIDIFAPVVGVVDMKEALREGYIADHVIYNYAIPLNSHDRRAYDKITDNFYKNFAVFGEDFDTAMAVLGDESARDAYARSLIVPGHTMTIEEWEEHQKHVHISAINFSRNMRKRKTFLYDHPAKIKAACDVVDKFNVKTIVFSQTKLLAERITEALGDIAVTYHSGMTKKQKQNSLAMFNSGLARVLVTAKAMDQGADLPDVELGIICAGNSTKLQDIQRIGRVVRKSPGKVARIVNIYIENTQDERWLGNRQSHMPVECVWVNDIRSIR